MPKDFNSRWYIAQPNDSDESPIAEAGRCVLNSTKAIRKEIAAFKAEIAKSEDLSDKGKARAVAKHALGAMTRYRQAQHRISKDLADHRQSLNKKTFEKLPEINPVDKYEIARWLREMTASERNAVLREAASGKMAGGHEVMSVVMSTFPRILGFSNDDPNYSTIRDTYLASNNPSAAAELLDIEVAENALAHAGDDLEEFVEEIAPGFRSALNADEGRTEWKDLTTTEKAEAVASGTSIADLMRDGSIVDRDEPAEAWDASLPLAEKVRLVAGE